MRTVLAFVVTVVVGTGTLFGQDGPSAAPTGVTTSALLDTYRTLVSVYNASSRNEDEASAIKVRIKKALSAADKERLEADLRQVGARNADLDKSLEQIATGVELKSFTTQEKVSFNWSDELQDLLGPIVHELRSLTARPRELERLRRDVDFFERRQLPVIDRALENLDRLEQGVPAVIDGLKELAAQYKAEAAAAEAAAKAAAKSIPELEKGLAAATASVARLTGTTAPAVLERARAAEKASNDALTAARTLVEEERKRAELATELAAARTADQATVKKLVARIKELRQTWQRHREQAKNNLTVAQHQLSEKLGEKIPFWESAHNLFALFFRSRGRNLVLGVVWLLVVFVLFRLAHRAILRVSPWHHGRERSFAVRLFDVFFHLMTFIGSIGAFIVVLYMYGDWVLLGLSMILVFGLAWAASKALPLFWIQTQLLLNLGTVREGERVVIDGLPWHVDSINIYTRLSNPALEGARLRLPLTDLMDMRSRPVGEHEPWFPCHEGDWVLLADETFGKVIVQTPEMVQLVLLGGSKKTYGTTDFLGQNPTNLSLGFRIVSTFGVDYADQHLATTSIPETMVTEITNALGEAGHDEYLENLKVEFAAAGTSSLDLVIIADFKGPAAQKYRTLDRFLQRAAVDCCTRHEWNIPFPQLTLHQAKS